MVKTSRPGSAGKGCRATHIGTGNMDLRGELTPRPAILIFREGSMKRR